MTIPIVSLPVIAASFVILGLALQLRLGRQALPSSRKINPWVAIAIGVVGFSVFAALFVASDRDERAYLADRGCMSEFGLSTTLPGSACGLQSARIVNAYQTYGRSASRQLVLALPDGTQRNVAIAASSSSPVFAGARSGTDRTAIVQLFRNRIVLIETSSGRVKATGYPALSRQKYGLVAIFLGFFGVAYCLKAAFQPTPSRTY